MPPPHRIIEELAGRQHGVVARRQLLAAGLSSAVVERRVRTGRLRPVHRGVYRVGPIEAPLLRESAAVLACGPGAVLARTTAAWVHGLLEARPTRVELSSTRGRSRRPGVRVSHVARLPPGDVDEVSDLPVTTVRRTLLDLSGAVTARTLEQAVSTALRRGTVDPDALLAALDGRRQPGAPALRRLLSAAREPAFTRSEAEERFLSLIRAADLERPAVNAGLIGYEVDFLWSRARVVVEVDGFAHHGVRHAFESDRRRDAALAAAGYRVLRVTWRQLTGEALVVVARVAGALAARGHGVAGAGGR